VDRLDVLDEITRLLAQSETSTLGLSTGLPPGLRDAAALAVSHLGLDSSAAALPATELRHAVETAVMGAALQTHYEQHPHARPSLVEVAAALAEQDGSALAGRLDLLEAAARAVSADVADVADVDADDVLRWAEAHDGAGG
jgi:hypothetical protein